MKKSIDNPNENNPLPSDILTIEEIRSCPALENISDEEALEAATSSYHLSQLAYQVFVEEQEFIPSKTDNK